MKTQNFFKKLDSVVFSSNLIIVPLPAKQSQSTLTCSKLTIETLEILQWICSDIFFVNFEHNFKPFSSVYIIEFEKVNFS